MYKTFSNTTIFTLTYIIFFLPTYFFAYTGIVKNGLEASILTLPAILYILSVAAIGTICMIRGALIGKKWFVLIPIVAFVSNLTPALSTIPFLPFVYHLLALLLGALLPVVKESSTNSINDIGKELII